jgi:hypothetical protein
MKGQKKQKSAAADTVPDLLNDLDLGTDFGQDMMMEFSPQDLIR